MPKPTLLQSIFNQPSQSYQFPPENQYHSTKDSLRQVAHGYSSHVISPPHSRPISLASSSLHSLPAAANIPEQFLTSPPGSVRAVSDILTLPESVSVRTSTSADLAIAAPSSSTLASHPPRTAHISYSQAQPAPHLSIAKSSYISQSMTSHKPFRFPPPPIPEDDPSDDDHTDIFYTPRSSLYSSPRVSRASSAFSEPKSSSVPPVPKLPSNSADALSTPSALRSKSSSTVTSRSSSSSDFGTVISSTTQATTSTRPTSPYNSSEQSAKELSPKQSDIQAIPISKSHPSSSSSSKYHPTKSNSRPHGVPATAGHRRTRSQTENGRFAATDTGWAENVRWLSSNAPAASAQRKAKKLPSQRQVTANGPPPAPINPRRSNGSAPSSLASGSGVGPYPPQAKSAETRESSTRHSRGSRGSRGRRRMSALLEEEEESEMSDLSISGSSDDSRPPSPPHLDKNKTTSTKVTIISTPEPSPEPTPGPSSSTPPRRRSASSNPNGSPRSILNSPGKRNGSVLTAEPEEMFEGLSTVDPDEDNPDNRLRAYARSSENQRQSYRRLSRSMSLTHTDPRAIASSLPTHQLPTPTPSSSTPTSPVNGYTGLTLPRAGLPSSSKRKPPDSSGKVDLPRSGVAQSSMATVEIIRGAANVQSAPPPPPPTVISPSTNTTSPVAGNSNSANGVAGGEKRKRKLSFSLKFLGDGSGSTSKAGVGNKLRKSSKESPTPAYLLDDMPVPVAFTARISPPTYVPASHVLIKVFAVGLDPLDSLLVKHKLEVAAGSGGKASKSKNKAVGYIPGRSLVGRVVQCGWDVPSDVCRKSDWVIASLDLRKSGALAEFVVVERHRIHRAPQPQFLTPQPLTPKRKPIHHRSMSVPINAANPTKSSYTTSLGIEELSLLPLCAVPAHRAVRTFNEVLNSRLSRAKRPHGRLKAFITNGHDGAGEIAVQILRQKNVAVSVQIPAAYTPIVSDKTANGQANPVANGKAPETTTSKKPSQEECELLEARLRAWGVEEIHIGDPLMVVQSLAAEKQSFDLFLDTIGGQEMWEYAQRLLLTEPADLPPPTSPTSPSENTTNIDQEATPKPKKQDSNSKGSVSHAHFCTLVGDHPTRPFPTAQDNIRSGFRSLRRAISTSRPTTPGIPSSAASSSTSVAAKDAAPAPAPAPAPAAVDGSVGKAKGKRTSKRSVGYSFVNPVADVDYQGEDLTESLSVVLEMVENGWIRPWIGDDGEAGTGGKVVLFEQSPEVFRRNATGPVGLLASGGTCVVKIAG